MDDQCELCDEGNEDGEEITEFWDPTKETSIIAHVECASAYPHLRMA